jgi:hypothetical protein
MKSHQKRGLLVLNSKGYANVLMLNWGNFQKFDIFCVKLHAMNVFRNV